MTLALGHGAQLSWDCTESSDIFPGELLFSNIHIGLKFNDIMSACGNILYRIHVDNMTLLHIILTLSHVCIIYLIYVIKLYKSIFWMGKHLLKRLLIR